MADGTSCERFVPDSCYFIPGELGSRHAAAVECHYQDKSQQRLADLERSENLLIGCTICETDSQAWHRWAPAVRSR